MAVKKNVRPAKKKPEEIRRDPLRAIEMSEVDWEEFERGVGLFNEMKFWHAHEAWEQVWLRHTEDERLFFQGLIQLAAAYHHLVTKRSVKGMVNNFEKAYSKLQVFQPEYLGIHVRPLLKFIEQIRLEGGGPGLDGFDRFNPNLIAKLQFQKPFNRDLLEELTAVAVEPQFLEGIRLFNEGYYWEAHEAWEEVWREHRGNARYFAQGMVQTAAAFSFIQRSKPESVIYLFEKALEKLRLYSKVECGIDLAALATQVEQALAHVRAAGSNGGRGASSSGAPTISLAKRRRDKE